MTAPAQQRIAIVGNGAVGLALAFRLQRSAPATRIVVFGPADLVGCYAGSTAAPAMINVLGEVTERIRSSWAARHMLEIGETAMHLWPEMADALNTELARLGQPTVDLYHGTYVFCRDGADDELANLEAMVSTLADRGHDFEELDLDRPLRHPVAQPDRFERGIYLPGEMFLDAGKLVRGLRAVLATRPNVGFHDGVVDRVDPDSLTLEVTDGHREQFDAVVLANSFGFNGLVEQFGRGDIPCMIPVYGVGSTVQAPVDRPFAARTPVYGASCGDYAVHYPGHLYVGASAIANTHRVEISSQLQRSIDFLDPAANLNGVRLTGGIRAMTQDTYPLLGPLRPGVWAAVGFYKSGVTLAPYAADLLARELLGELPLLENGFGCGRRSDEEPPPLAQLVQTITDEIAASASSSGSAKAIRSYGWLVRLLVRWNAYRTTRALKPGIFYNSDIVQACIHDPSLIGRLNRWHGGVAAA